jgi:hypothetical protein
MPCLKSFLGKTIRWALPFKPRVKTLLFRPRINLLPSFDSGAQKFSDNYAMLIFKQNVISYCCMTE